MRLDESVKVISVAKAKKEEEIEDAETAVPYETEPAEIEASEAETTETTSEQQDKE